MPLLAEPAGLKVQIREVIGQGNLEALEELVLHGHGDRLLGETSPNPLVQEFLDIVPGYIEQINDVHRAVVRGRLREVQTLMSHRSLSLARDSLGATPVHKAVMHGHYDVAQHLADNFRDALCAKDVKGKTADYYLQYPEKLGLDQIIKRNQLANATHLGNTVSRLKALAPPTFQKTKTRSVLPSCFTFEQNQSEGSQETPDEKSAQLASQQESLKKVMMRTKPMLPPVILPRYPTPASPDPLRGPWFPEGTPPCPVFSPSPTMSPSPIPTEPFPFPTSPFPTMYSPSPYTPMEAPYAFSSPAPYHIVPPLPPRPDTAWPRLDRDRNREDKQRKAKNKRRRRSASPAKRLFTQRQPFKRRRPDSETPSTASIGKLIAELQALDAVTSATTVRRPPYPWLRAGRSSVLSPQTNMVENNLPGMRYLGGVGYRQRSRESGYEDNELDICTLNACVPVVLIVAFVLLMLLGTASKLLQTVSEDFPVVDAPIRSPMAGQGRSARVAVEGAVATIKTPVTPADGSTGDCSTDSCLWEGQYLLGKLNHQIPPCHDFYSHVCSDAWFKDSKNLNSQPFSYRASSAVIEALWKALQRQAINESTFVSHAALILRHCIPGRSQNAASDSWSAMHRILEDLGLKEWPYGDTLPSTDIHDIAKVADKMLGLSSIVSMSVRERPADRKILLHLNSPPILLRRHEDIFPGEQLNTYETFVARVLTLLKAGSWYTKNQALEIVRFEERLSDAAADSARSVPMLHVVRPLGQVKSYSHWNWNEYFLHFLTGSDGQHSFSELVLLDELYFKRLSSILSQVSSRTLANYIGYKLLVHLSPLLPPSDAEFMLPLSHSHHSAGSVPARTEACMYLLERLYPYGTRILVWATVIRSVPGIISGEIADDLRQMEELARFEMRQSAATAPWLSQEEADRAVLKIDRLRVVLAPKRAELELPYPLLYAAAILMPDGGGTTILETYYTLMRTLRAHYWSTANLTYFHEPLLPTESAFQAGFSYDVYNNVVSMSPATVAFVAAISRRFDHTAVPFLLGQLLRGMFSVIDVRGSTVNADGDLLSWWSSTSEDRFLGRARCLQARTLFVGRVATFGVAVRRYLRDGLAAALFLEENVLDGAVLRPLYNVYSRVVKKGDASAAIAGQPRELTVRQLFFLNWASTLCEPNSTADMFRKRLRYKIRVPARLRVNVALSRFFPFAEAFNCPVGSRLNPTRACSFW
ncbi:hypothetical protein HPB48_020710 [Haemaphysalis longicornis]|uniref:Uncharacterized protein n=1 Tax=Haemaphysalis longicornis TaxID=44386 RepID=A0A9J6G6I6_HAELO|nr:hypothetical protein HPB48_020710 [Haemaphysalis longicornis]